ncbi:WG repeat-containing protein [Acholeplasma sp. OttesenSCG-928-E16]|nr:WG repeat-containing protein [Acholeplasma sp. OttesenSCG-928-E16]
MKKVLTSLFVMVFLFTMVACDINLNSPEIIAAKNEKYGFIDLNGNVVIPLEYDQIEGFYSNGMAIVKKNNKYGLINKKNQVEINIEYEDYRSFYFSLDTICLKKDSKWGVLDISGKELIPFDYDDFKYDVYQNYLIAQKDGKWGVVNHANEVVIPFLFQDILPQTERLFAVKFNDKYGFVESGLNSVDEFEIDYEYDNVKPFFGGLAPVKKESKWGFINKQNQIEIDFIYDDVNMFIDGYAIVLENNKWGVIDTKGKIILDLIYDKIEYRHKNEVIIYKADEAAYASSQFKIFFNETFDLGISEIGDFSNFGLASVKKNNKYGFITKFGDLKIDFIFDGVKYTQEDNIIAVLEDGFWGLNDMKNEVLISSQYDDIVIVNDDYIIIKRDNKYGLADRYDSRITKFEFDVLTIFDEKTFK